MSFNIIMRYNESKFCELLISYPSKITCNVINLHVRRCKLQNEVCRKLIVLFARRTGNLRDSFCTIPTKIDQKNLNKCEGRIVERAKNTGIVVNPFPLDPSPVTRLSCGAERWGLDIRSDVESVTRFSVIESKISLKNEHRSRDASPRYYWVLRKGEGMRGRRGSARASRVKIDLPTKPSHRAVGIRYRLYTLHSASRCECKTN